MTKVKLTEIIEIPWILLGCCFWALLATYRNQKLRYVQWRCRRFKEECDYYKSIVKDGQTLLEPRHKDP